jgi:peptidyl-prolyl cis-trans isomerase D
MLKGIMMLETMRNAAKGWVAKVLMALLVLSFSIWGIKDVGTSFSDNILGVFGLGPKDLVQVAGKAISATEYTNALQRQLKLISQQSGQNVTIDEAHKLGLDKQVLDNLIATAAIDAQRSKFRLAISDNTVRDGIFANKAFQDSAGKFDPATYRRVLQANGLSEEGFVVRERQGQLFSAVTGIAATELKLPQTFNLAVAQFGGQSRDAKYFVVTATEADVAQPTEAELKKAYEAAPAAYTAPEYRSIAVMKVDPADLAAKMSITPEELKAGYAKYQGEYFTPEKRDILQLVFKTLDDAKKAKSRIAAGEDFMKIATEMGAKEVDILLKDQTKGDFLDSKVSEAAFALKEGTVSDPVEGSLAIALLKAVKVAPEKQSTLDEVKPALTSRLQLDKARDEIQTTYNDVEDARGKQQKFEEIAKAVGLPLLLVPAVSAGGLDPTGKDVAIPSKPDVLKAAYASDVGLDNDALLIGDGYVWYETRQVIPSALKPLDAVKDEVKKNIIADKMRGAAGEKAKKLVEQLKAGANFESLATEAKATVSTAAGIKRNEASAEFDGPAVSALFAAPDKGFAWTLEGDGKSARVMQVTKDTLPSMMATSDAIKKMQSDSASSFEQDMGQSYIKALRANANVTINDELWKLNTGTEQTQ